MLLKTGRAVDTGAGFLLEEGVGDPLDIVPMPKEPGKFCIFLKRISSNCKSGSCQLNDHFKNKLYFELVQFIINSSQALQGVILWIVRNITNAI